MKNIMKSFAMMLAGATLLTSFSGCADMAAEKNAEDEVSFVCYTREANNYSTHMAYSFHLAYKKQGEYIPLYDNIGLCYAKALVDEETGFITPMALEKPYVFKLRNDDGWGILARRIKANGESDETSRGKLLLFVTEDFISYKEIGLVDLKINEHIVNFACEYDKISDEYKVYWQSSSGLNHVAKTFDILSLDKFLESEEDRGFTYSNFDSGIEGAVNGNEFKLDALMAERLIKKFSKIENTSVEVPESIKASSEDELSMIGVTAHYSDGSSMNKAVDWDVSKVDFSKPGKYNISGTIRQIDIKYPCAPLKADPAAIYYEGKYYFIATHEQNQSEGLYLRSAETLEGLFAENVEEHLILAYNEAKNFVSCFWAPELHNIDGDLYVLFAVSGAAWNPQSHMLKLKDGGDPIDPNGWEEPIRVVKNDGEFLSDGALTIDMTHFVVDGVDYLVWAQRSFSPCDSGSLLYIATTDPKKPWQLTSDPVLISSPVFSWENDMNTPVDEGPFAFIRDGIVHLSFSGSSTGDDYAVGVLKAKVSDDLLNAESWAKTNYPLLCSESVKGEHGPGHSSFVCDEYGTWWYLYHGRDMSILHEGWSSRDTGIRALHFDFEGDLYLSLTPEEEILEKYRKVKTTLIVE